MTDQNGNGGEAWRHFNSKCGSVVPAKPKSVKQMMAGKVVESTSKFFKNDKRKVKPEDDDSD